MGTLRSFAYEDPNYTVTRQHSIVSAPAASNVTFAKFRSRAAIVVNRLILAVNSVGSAAKVIFTAYRGTSLHATFTMDSCTTVGNVTQISMNCTLLSTGDMIGLRGDDGAKGTFHIVYEYQVLPGESLYVTA